MQHSPIGTMELKTFVFPSIRVYVVESRTGINAKFVDRCNIDGNKKHQKSLADEDESSGKLALQIGAMLSN